MTCCILEKSTVTTYIPGSPAGPATPGSPGHSAYCATEQQQVCEWVPNPNITWRYECWWSIGQNREVCGMVPYINGVPGGNTGYPLNVYQCHSVDVTTCYPEVLPTPGTPGVPATPSQIITSLNLGWNSTSRAIDPLEAGSSLLFTVKNGVRGVFVGVGHGTLAGLPISMFGIGLMIDASGVHVFENGVQVHELAASYTALTEFRIERNTVGAITYKADAVEYTSSNAVSGDVYPHAYMYSGGDRIMCASYAAITPTTFTAEATMSGASAFLIGPPSVDGTFLARSVLAGSGALAVDEAYPYTVTLSGSGLFVITPTATSLFGYAPALECVLGESGVDYAFVGVDLPAMTMRVDEAVYVPPALTTMYGNLPILACGMLCSHIEIDELDVTLPAIEAVMGEGDYAFIEGDLPSLGLALIEGNRLDMSIFSGLIGRDPMSMRLELVLTLMSNGELASVQTMTRIIAMEYMSELQAASIQDLMAKYGLSLMSALRVASISVQAYDAGAALPGIDRVWVVNLDTAAASQYDDFAFNSFFERGGQWYGVADDGIYLLEGADDYGAVISADVQLGQVTFTGTPARVEAVYVAAVSDDRMHVRVDVGGLSRVYETHLDSTDVRNQRAKLGRGLKGRNWTFSILNKDGCDFEIEGVDFTPVAANRRI